MATFIRDDNAKCVQWHSYVKDYYVLTAVWTFRIGCDGWLWFFNIMIVNKTTFASIICTFAQNLKKNRICYIFKQTSSALTELSCVFQLCMMQTKNLNHSHGLIAFSYQKMHFLIWNAVFPCDYCWMAEPFFLKTKFSEMERKPNKKESIEPFKFNWIALVFNKYSHSYAISLFLLLVHYRTWPQTWVTWNIISTMKYIKFIRFKLDLQSTTNTTEMAIKCSCSNTRVTNQSASPETERSKRRRKENQIVHTITVTGNSKNVELKFNQKCLLLSYRFCLIRNQIGFIVLF